MSKSIYFFLFVNTFVTFLKFIIINNITIQIDYNQYIEYRRTRKSELDLFANILSLFSNIFFGAGLIFKYYASHFNNYKIVEKLLNKYLLYKIRLNKFFC